MQKGAIDIHHHYVPEQIVGEAKRHGKALGIEVSEDKDGSIYFSFNGGPRYPLQRGLTDVEPRLAMMAKGKIALAALDPSTQLLGYDLKGEQAESWCRIHNESVKEFLKKYPDRFTAMAAVPIQEPARAARVLEHAVTQLDFRGAYIATNVNHRYYDSEDFDPFWAKAQELDVLVFMHPDNAAGTELMGAYGLRLVCGNPADTTLSLGILIYSGVLDRFPNLKLCTCHGGGFFPYQVGRLERGREIRDDIKKATRRMAREALGWFYYDTILFDPKILEFLISEVGADHVLLGSDCPFGIGDPNPTRIVLEAEISAVEKDQILSGNALRLFQIKSGS